VAAPSPAAVPLPRAEENDDEIESRNANTKPNALGRSGAGMKIHLKKGHDALTLTLPDDKAVQVLEGNSIPPLAPDKIAEIIARGIKAHSPGDLAGKRTAILIPDDTRLWARGDRFVPHIVKARFSVGLPEGRLKIIIAIGTHRAMPPSQFSQLAGSFDGRNVAILNAANRDRSRLIHLGVTSRGTSVEITRDAVEADHIVIFGGVLHHHLAGYGGGRKYILPGIAGYDAVQQNHSLAIRPDGTPHPLVQAATLRGNPVHEDLEEAADLFLKEKTCTYVAVAVNGRGEIFHCGVGPLGPTFLSACRKLDQACCLKVPHSGDFALISAGGHRTDGQLYQATKALFNAARVVKKGGAILFVAGCSEGVGNQVFADALSTFKTDPGKLGDRLAKVFDMPAFVALQVIELLDKFHIGLLSDLAPELARELGFHVVADAQSWVDGLAGRGYIIPFAENILALPETHESR
jgi:nickel-dependent lactate racemase